MDADTRAEIARLQAEIGNLRAGMQQQGEEQMNGGNGADIGCPLVPLGGADYGAFRFEGNKITHCNFYAAHTVVELQDKAIQQGDADGTWYLNVPHQNPGSATVSRTEGRNDEDNTSIKLFTIENGEVKKDYRGMPFIPIYA